MDQPTLLYMALHFRETRFSSTYQNTSTSPPTRKTSHGNGPNSSMGGRNHNKDELRPSSLKKGDSKHSKLNDRKRQRNMQQMKEHCKNPQDQINDKEIGSLPEKKFRVMRVKMNQNCEKNKNKTEVQINRSEVWIEV